MKQICQIKTLHAWDEISQPLIIFSITPNMPNHIFIATSYNRIIKETRTDLWRSVFHCLWASPELLLLSPAWWTLLLAGGAGGIHLKKKGKKRGGWEKRERTELCHSLAASSVTGGPRRPLLFSRQENRRLVALLLLSVSPGGEEKTGGRRRGRGKDGAHRRLGSAGGSPGCCRSPEEKRERGAADERERGRRWKCFRVRFRGLFGLFKIGKRNIWDLGHRF